MAEHNQTGITGEQLALKFFTDKGYNILHLNWRCKRWEVDIIADKNNTLHFIEVKTRKTKNYGLPEDNVTVKKIQNLISAAEEYLYQYPQWNKIQFDVLSVSILRNKPVEYFLIEDVYL